MITNPTDDSWGGETKSDRFALLSMPTLLVLPASVISDNDPVGLHNQADRGARCGSGGWPTNTILRHCDKLFATWQGYDPNTGKYIVWVSTNQLGTSLWSAPVARPKKPPSGG